jgi:hypothetical protein
LETVLDPKARLFMILYSPIYSSFPRTS